MLKYLRGRSFGYIFRFVLAAPLALVIWLCIEIINIFRPVYIVGLSYKGRISHYMRPMELHLRNANQLNKKYKMIFVMPAATPNEAVRTVYRRHALIIDAHYPKIIRNAFGIVSVLLKHRFTAELLEWHDLWQLEPATTLTDVEIKFGDELLQSLGIPKGAKYVCLSVKDASYYGSITPDKGYGQDLSHQAKDSRNVDITNYMLAATHLANLGIYVIRMGSVVTAPLPKVRHNLIIDYATEARSELGDVTLYRNCLFELNGTAGSFILAASANRPIVQCDEYEIGSESQKFHPPRAILAFSLIKESNSGRLLSFREIIKLGKSGQNDESLMRLGLERRNNTETEILECVKELMELIIGDLTLSSQSKVLQVKFFECYDPPLDPISKSLVLVSPSFLRKYQDLL